MVYQSGKYGKAKASKPFSKAARTSVGGFAKTSGTPSSSSSSVSVVSSPKYDKVIISDDKSTRVVYAPAGELPKSESGYSLSPKQAQYLTSFVQRTAKVPLSHSAAPVFTPESFYASRHSYATETQLKPITSGHAIRGYEDPYSKKSVAFSPRETVSQAELRRVSREYRAGEIMRTTAKRQPLPVEYINIPKSNAPVHNFDRTELSETISLPYQQANPIIFQTPYVRSYEPSGSAFDKKLFNIKKSLETKEIRFGREGVFWKSRMYGAGSAALSTISSSKKRVELGKIGGSSALVVGGLSIGTAIAGPVVPLAYLGLGAVAGVRAIPKLQDKYAKAQFLGPVAYRESFSQDTTRVVAALGGGYAGYKVVGSVLPRYVQSGTYRGKEIKVFRVSKERYTGFVSKRREYYVVPRNKMTPFVDRSGLVSYRMSVQKSNFNVARVGKNVLVAPLYMSGAVGTLKDSGKRRVTKAELRKRSFGQAYRRDIFFDTQKGEFGVKIPKRVVGSSGLERRTIRIAERADRYDKTIIDSYRDVYGKKKSVATTYSTQEKSFVPQQSTSLKKLFRQPYESQAVSKRLRGTRDIESGKLKIRSVLVYEKQFKGWKPYKREIKYKETVGSQYYTGDRVLKLDKSTKKTMRTGSLGSIKLGDTGLERQGFRKGMWNRYKARYERGFDMYDGPRNKYFPSVMGRSDLGDVFDKFGRDVSGGRLRSLGEVNTGSLTGGKFGIIGTVMTGRSAIGGIRIGAMGAGATRQSQYSGQSYGQAQRQMQATIPKTQMDQMYKIPVVNKILPQKKIRAVQAKKTDTIYSPRKPMPVNFDIPTFSSGKPKIKIEVIPKPKVPNLSRLDLPQRKQQKKISKRSKFRQLDWNPIYTPSIAASVFKIYGKAPKVVTGAELRPIRL